MTVARPVHAAPQPICGLPDRASTRNTKYPSREAEIMNNATLIGRLGHDPVLRRTEYGAEVAEFSVAVDNHAAEATTPRVPTGSLSRRGVRWDGRWRRTSAKVTESPCTAG
jgi:hypothetical protein